MKILIVLALLFSLGSAYVDFQVTHLANATQAGLSPTLVPGNCTFVQKYVASTGAFSGTFTCQGLSSNITMAHIHNTGDTTYYPYNTVAASNVIEECPITINADRASGSWSCSPTFTNITNYCVEQLYYAVHTTMYPGSEVRANIVNVAALCYVTNGVTLNSVVVQEATPVVPAAPLIEVPNFFFGAMLVPIGTTPMTSGGYGYLSFVTVGTRQMIIFSGILYGFTSPSINFIRAYFDLNPTSAFITFATPTFSPNLPFVVRQFVPADLDAWDISKIISSRVTFKVELTDGTELSFTVKGDFPSSEATCRPYIKDLPTTAINCYQTGSYDPSTGDKTLCSPVDYFCGIDNNGGTAYWGCTSYTNCYDCDCGAALSDLPSGGYACCDYDGCNKPAIELLNCLNSGAGSISVGLLATLVVLIMKWFF